MSNWKKGKLLNNGQYTIESILLRDGAGLAYRGKDNQTGKLVTIRVTDAPWREKSNGREIEAKLVEQALKICQCQHPYLIKIHPEIGREEDKIYIITDYLQGQDLAQQISVKGKLEEYSALKIVSKIGSAVNVLHKNRAIHQDLKPQHIILEQNSQQPILIDYGLALQLFAFDTRKRNNAMQDYFSPPEKYNKSTRKGTYSDVYSLAATLYVLVTAELPTPAKVRQYQALIPPKQLNPELSDVTNHAILRGMALNPAQRPHFLKDWFELLKQDNTKTQHAVKHPTAKPAHQNIPDDDDDDEDTTAPLTPIINLQEEETVVQKRPISNNENFEETIVQRKPLQRQSLSNQQPIQTYPDIENIDIETLTISPKKELFGLINGVEKNMISRRIKLFVEELGENTDLEMIFIPAGTFVMGSNNNEIGRDKDESPTHRVKLNSFYMSKYPITQLQWRIVMSYPQVKRPVKNNPSLFKGDDLPVEKVSWLDAQEFCQRLSKFTGRKYRLPTETEWEYACRGGTQTPFFFGDMITTDFANYDGREGYGCKPTGKYEKKTTPVGKFEPNPFGLYDVHGNVWEWCEDHYANNYTNKPKDGSAFYSRMGNQPRVVRGGSWSLSPKYCRSAKRSCYAPDSNYNFLGFRVVCVID